MILLKRLLARNVRSGLDEVFTVICSTFERRRASADVYDLLVAVSGPMFETLWNDLPKNISGRRPCE
jgi:hypothetical protein